ncbi:MAG: hypothetical protein ACXIUL_07820 [Wenzhouxiangella sp.]
MRPGLTVPVAPDPAQTQTALSQLVFESREPIPLRRLWAIRREMLGCKLVLLRYAGAVRLSTLPVLLLISLAVLACVFQLLLALLSLPLVLVSLAI